MDLLRSSWTPQLSPLSALTFQLNYLGISVPLSPSQVVGCWDPSILLFLLFLPFFPALERFSASFSSLAGIFALWRLVLYLRYNFNAKQDVGNQVYFSKTEQKNIWGDNVMAVSSEELFCSAAISGILWACLACGCLGKSPHCAKNLNSWLPPALNNQFLSSYLATEPFFSLFFCI